ncbi:Uncharacterised protein [Vibrio cholerae]|nr:Uncharacterised protein [Vibrio cholerae]
MTSANTRITKVKAPVAIATPKSPYRRIPIMVAIAEARILTRLLPIRIKPIKRSGRSSSFSTRLAPLWPLLAKCFKR